jgi:hypothetical protein
MFCTQCGYRLKAGDEICASCGNALSNAPPAVTKLGTLFLKWAARVVGFALVVIAHFMLKDITEEHELESGIAGTYRAITLLLAYYLFWVFTRKIDGSFYKDTERPGDDPQGLSPFEIALFGLFVCVAVGSGFFAAHFVYIEVINRSVSENIARIYGFIAFIVGAGTTLGVLSAIADADYWVRSES